jgi:hypothetical protein
MPGSNHCTGKNGTRLLVAVTRDVCAAVRRLGRLGNSYVQFEGGRHRFGKGSSLAIRLAVDANMLDWSHFLQSR